MDNKMGIMPVGKLLINMAWPAVLSMMVQAIYNVIDSFFVAQTGEAGLTALTLVFPFQMLMISVAVGTGVGINSLISRRLGAEMYEEANTAASNGFKLSFINWIFFAVIGLFFANPYMEMFIQDDYIIHQGSNYLRIVSVGCLFLMVQIVTEKILQSTGNMILPMLSTILGAVINILLDPILIFGLFGAPKLGVTGAGIATVIAQGCGMALSVIVLFRMNHRVKVNWKERFHGKTLKEIYAVGLPSILMQSMVSVMQFGMNMILSSFSATAVAVLGVYGRLQSFFFMPVFGINQGAMPVFGYNYGAENSERLVKAFKVAFLMAFSIMSLGLFVFQMFPGELLGLFSASETMCALGIPALRRISLCFLPAAFGILASGLFGAMGHGFISLFGSLLRQLVGILPLAWIFGWLGGVEMVWWAFPGAEVIGLTYSILMLRLFYNKKIKDLGKQEGKNSAGKNPA